MIQTINISLIPSDNKPVINVSQYDNVLRVLRFNVFDDIEMEVPHVFDDTETVLLNIRKNDNNIVVITGEIVTETDPETEEVTEQYLTFELTEQACACVGSNYGEVSITNGDDEVIGSCNFKLIVERSPLAGGVDSQSEIDNLTTQIESISEQVIGENYYDKEEIDSKFDDLDIPTKTSDLENDSGFITASDIPTIPTKTSQLTNDSGFITASDIPTIPTKTSQLTNDSGFINSTELNNVLSDYALWPTDQTTKSAIANFTTSLTKPLEFKAYIDSASGLSALNLTECGANIWDEQTELGAWSDSRETWIPSTVQLKSKNFIPIKPNTTYRLKNPTGTISRYVYYDKNKNYLSFTNANSNLAFTTPSNAYYMMFGLAATYGTTYNNDVSINYPSTDTTYHAYNGNTTTIQLGQTVYGGYLTQDKDGHRVLSADGVTINLPDGTPINTLSGVNNVYADTGDIEVSYKCTIEEYINNRLSSTRTLNRAVTLEERSIEENLSETRDIRRNDNEE